MMALNGVKRVIVTSPSFPAASGRLGLQRVNDALEIRKLWPQDPMPFDRAYSRRFRASQILALNTTPRTLTESTQRIGHCLFNKSNRRTLALALAKGLCLLSD